MTMRIWLAIAVVIALSAGWIWYQDSANPLKTTSDDPGEIVAAQPAKGATVAKRFVVSGEANSLWFYEGKLPVTVTDKRGAVIWEGFATSTGDWTQAGTIPFLAKIDLGRYAGPATIEIARDNPSGESSYDARISVPVTVTSDTDAVHYAYDPGEIFIYSAASGGVIAPAFSLEGTAQNAWFSGGSALPAEIRAQGKDIWKGQATTAADTKVFGSVDFTVSGDVGSYRGKATLILHAANPNGDPAYEASYALPVDIE